MLIQRIFDKTAKVLMEAARLTGLTYNEINILVYYLVIPLSWTILIDLWLTLPITTPLLLLAWGAIYLKVRHRFDKWCDWMFKKSVDFLMYFNRYGSNYVLSSVIFCIIVPIAIYAFLITLTYHTFCTTQ